MTEQLVAVIASTKRRGFCRSDACRKPLTWYLTHPNRKTIPFDGDPVPRKSERVDGEVIEFLPAYENHFRTCPDAKKFRR